MANARSALPARLIPVFAVGAVLALGGGLWDDAWHTERGRDSFFIAPHIAIYGGVTVIGMGLSLWLLLATRSVGWRMAVREPAIALAALSVGVTLGSAPVDNAWHLAFGRDAVIWSPPHVLGIVGTGSLAIVILVELARSPAAWARRAEGPVGGLVLAAFAFLVVEYETDVPQFAAVWYLPVLALGAGFAFAVVARLGSSPTAVTRAALWHLIFVAATSLFLLSAGFDAPRLPLLIAPAVVLDLAGRRGVSACARGGLAALALFAVTVPALDLIGDGVRLGAEDVVVGLPLAWAALAAMLGLLEGRRCPRLSPPLGAALLLLAILPATALAHDPGQGPPAGTVDLRVRAARGIATVATRPAVGDPVVPIGIVARRAGTSHRGPLRQRRSGLLSGRVRLGPEGRWFVYVDLRRSDGHVVEAWLPVRAGSEPSTVRDARRFAYLVDRKPSSTVKWVAGSFLYALVVAFVGAVVVLVRRTTPKPATPA